MRRYNRLVKQRFRNGINNTSEYTCAVACNATCKSRMRSDSLSETPLVDYPININVFTVS